MALIVFERQLSAEVRLLNGTISATINADLSSGIRVTEAAQLNENTGAAFVATVKAGPFDIPGELARQWLSLPNPHGRPNTDVLRPWSNGRDVTRRPSDTWIIDFGVGMPLEQAVLYERPFAHVEEHVKAKRDASGFVTNYKSWWLMARPIPAMRKALEGLNRYIVTPVVGKHRLFAWMDARVLADHQLVVVARDDDATLGLLHSRIHEVWSLSLCTWLGVGNDPRYTPTTTFETFPFPSGLTPSTPPAAFAADPRAKQIAAAAKRLVDLRETWLNPPEFVNRVPEIVPGYPDRLLPANDAAAKELKKRTLTNLYNANPAWLQHAHRELDDSVAAAYGWEWPLPDEEILDRLLTLNRARSR